MENTADVRNKSGRMFSFDLKGSMIARDAELVNPSKQISERKFSQLMKDVNFLDINNMYWRKKLLRINEDQRSYLNETIKKDSLFLQCYNIMDYSLLVVGEQLSEEDAGTELTGLTRNQYQSTDKSELYHIAIIDALQDWNLDKKQEQFAKTKFLCKK